MDYEPIIISSSQMERDFRIINKYGLNYEEVLYLNGRALREKLVQKGLPSEYIKKIFALRKREKSKINKKEENRNMEERISELKKTKKSLQKEKENLIRDIDSFKLYCQLFNDLNLSGLDNEDEFWDFSSSDLTSKLYYGRYY